MSKFLELIESKSVLYRVRLKVDPALCVNGEIKKHESYEGFILSETEKGKKFEGLLSKYKIQNEGIFDSIGQNLKNAAVAVGKKLKDDVVSPFKDPKYNPFVSDKNKVDTGESGEIIKEMEMDWLDVKKTISFTVGKLGVYNKSYEQIANEDRGTYAFFNKFKRALVSNVESFGNSSFLNLVSEAAPAPAGGKGVQLNPAQMQQHLQNKARNKSKQNAQNIRNNQFQESVVQQIKSGISQTDLNQQLAIRNMKEKFLPQIKAQIEKENGKKREIRQDTLKVSADDVWKTLVQKVEETMKAARSGGYVPEEKVLWTFILAQPNQRIVLTYNPSRQPQVNAQGQSTAPNRR